MSDVTSSNANASVVLLGAEATVWATWRTDGAPAWAFSNQVSSVNTGLPPIEATLTGLQPDTAYECAFYATNGTLVAEDWSAVASFITPLSSAQTPTGLSATYQDGEVRVEWTDASSTADLFLIRWWEDGSLTTNLETAVASPFLHYPVTADTTYFYQVGASNTVNGSFSGFSGAVSETTPSVIEGRITPVAAKQSNSFSLQRTVDNLASGVGMNAEETIFYNLDGTEAGEPSSANGVVWMTTGELDEVGAAAEGRVWIVADLGGTYALSTLQIWNFQWNLNGSTDLSDRGVSQFDLLVRNAFADTDDGTIGGTEINLDNPNDNLIDNDAVFNLGTCQTVEVGAGKPVPGPGAQHRHLHRSDV